MTPLREASIFTRRVIASVCMLEQMTAASDPSRMFDHEIAQFHAEEVASDSPYLPAGIHAVSKQAGRYYVIKDNEGAAHGSLAVYDEATTFIYSVITG